MRQLAAAFMPHLPGIEWINRTFKEGASKLAHSKGFASGKKYAALAGTAALPAAPEHGGGWENSNYSSFNFDCNALNSSVPARRSHSKTTASAVLSMSPLCCSRFNAT